LLHAAAQLLRVAGSYRAWFARRPDVRLPPITLNLIQIKNRLAKS
jgi:hypothetical protein